MVWPIWANPMLVNPFLANPFLCVPTGLHTTTRELQSAHLTAPALPNTTKKPREDPQRETNRAKMEAGDGKKSAKFWAPTLRGHPLGPTIRCPTLRGPNFSGFGPTDQNWIGQNWIGQSQSLPSQGGAPKGGEAQNFEDARLRPMRLRPAGRSRNWPKSKLAEVEQM